jgi:hypothetical protein
LEHHKEKKMAFGGILGSLMGNVGLIEKGASMMGYTMPGWAKAGIGIAAHTFGSKGDAGGGGASMAREHRAVDFGGSIGMGQQKMIGPGEQKASAAVEYEEELARLNNIIRLYAEAT